MPIKPPARCSHSRQPVDKRISSTQAPANYDVADATRPGSARTGCLRLAPLSPSPHPSTAMLLRPAFRSLDAPQRVNRTGGLADNPDHAP